MSENYAKYNIQVPNGKISGEVKTTCPECSHNRKKKTDRCLSINLDKKVWHCFNCGWDGFLKPERIVREVYTKPVWKNNTELSYKLVKWFESRGIKQETLIFAKVTEGLEWMPQTQKQENTILFNYFWNGELINIKYRSATKGFKLHKDAELIFYNLECLNRFDKVYIVEGEIDALTLIQCGIENVLSVPNGANPGTNNLQYVDNCIELFNHVKEIILATDNDLPGRKLRDDLAERFGIDKCKYIESEDFKDLNEVMVRDGMVGVLNVLKTAKDFPLEGAFTVSDYHLDIEDLYHNGLDNGTAAGLGEFDNHLRFVKGYITGVTGIPGMGKSDFVDMICMKLLVKAGWKTAFYSPENKPTKLHFSKLARKLTGKAWFGDGRLSLSELAQTEKYLQDNVWFIKPTKNFTLETILSHARQLKRQKGIDILVIDAWNKLEHKYGVSETKYIGESLDMLANFCEAEQIHCFLVAHPRKMEKDKNTGAYVVPNLYDIAGSANFFNKLDNGISVHRVYDNGEGDYVERGHVQIHTQKVKFSHWGQTGMDVFDYDVMSGRYFPQYTQDFSNWMGEPSYQIKIDTNAVPNEFDNFGHNVLPPEREPAFNENDLTQNNDEDPF